MLSVHPPALQYLKPTCPPHSRVTSYFSLLVQHPILLLPRVYITQQPLLSLLPMVSSQPRSEGFLPRIQAESRFCSADRRLHGVVSTGAGSVALLNSGGTSAHLALYPVTCLAIILPRPTRKESSRRTLTIQTHFLKTLLEEFQLFTIHHTHWPPG